MVTSHGAKSAKYERRCFTTTETVLPPPLQPLNYPLSQVCLVDNNDEYVYRYLPDTIVPDTATAPPSLLPYRRTLLVPSPLLVRPRLLSFSVPCRPQHRPSS